MSVLDSPTGHLWDLRQGDADDNRTSPYGRGWRNVIVSTALEFNYLTASISFLMLVIVPALAVGLDSGSTMGAETRAAISRIADSVNVPAVPVVPFRIVGAT